jgi:hypothetical protein
MYNEQEIAEAYALMTDGSRYLALKTNHKPEPDFEQFWKRSFEVIEDMPEANL